MPDDIRDEAEKLVTAAIAAVSMAARSLNVPGNRAGGGFATGSPECCVCPVCRVIAAMRDPNPDLAEKLSAGAGELASSVANLLRNLSRGGNGTDRGADARASREGDEFWEELRRRARGGGDEADPWHAATTSPSGGGTSGGGPSGGGSGASSPGSPPAPPTVKKAMAKKAVAKKAVPAKVPAAAPTKAGAARAAKTAAAKAATTKAVPKKASGPRETG